VILWVLRIFKWCKFTVLVFGFRCYKKRTNSIHLIRCLPIISVKLMVSSINDTVQETKTYAAVD
jgi:hypothetical protein